MSLCALLAEPILFVRPKSPSIAVAAPFTTSNAPARSALIPPAPSYHLSQVVLPAPNPRKRSIGVNDEPQGEEQVQKRQKRFQDNDPVPSGLQPAHPRSTLSHCSNSPKTRTSEAGNQRIIGRGYGNTSGTHCYRNASLQALGGVKQFRDLILSHKCRDSKQCITCHLGDIFRDHYRSRQARRSPHEPPQLRLIAKRIGGSFARRRFADQEDAHEYIALLLDRLSESSGKSVGDMQKNLNDMFHVSKITAIQCLNGACRHVVRRQNQNDTLIMLNIPTGAGRRDTICLEDCLQDYSKAERIADYKCESCGKLGIKKKTFIETPPVVALISLSRFRLAPNGRRIKDKRNVKFPNEIHLGKPSGSHNKQRSILSAIICHESSSIESGHYYAVVRVDEHLWIKYDDTDLSLLRQLPENLEAKWYLLLYTLADG